MWWTLAATCPPTGCRLGPRKNRVETGSAGRDSTRFVAAPRRWAAGSPGRDYAAGRSYGPGRDACARDRPVRATLRAACQDGSEYVRRTALVAPARARWNVACLYRGDWHCGGPHGSPAENVGEAQPSTVFCIGGFIEAANWCIGHGIVHSVKEGHYAIFL
jgi:hypothetical protein